MSHPPSPYIGRFAPSPTGPLHAGSLLTALASFLDARHHNGRWLVRIEDIDPPREQPGASRAILRALAAHQLHWDGPVTYQSKRLAQYRNIVADLIDRQLAFYCRCSRQQLKGHRLYPGTCRRQQQKPAEPAAVRVIAQPVTLSFNDPIQGRHVYDMAADIGDFVIFRKDGLVAYQLATAYDDYAQGITHVVRGSDLLDSTPRQMYLQQLLGTDSPHYAHVPVLADASGQKLSKQNLAAPLNLNHCPHNLYRALVQLNQQPPESLRRQGCQQILEWASSHWCPERIPHVTQIAVNPAHPGNYPPQSP